MCRDVTASDPSHETGSPIRARDRTFLPLVPFMVECNVSFGHFFVARARFPLISRHARRDS